MFWIWFFMCLFPLICFAIAVIQIISTRKHKTQEFFDLENANARPKIGAEVSNRFYDEVKRYCAKHHMTISDLIRESVRAYMDTNR